MLFMILILLLELQKFFFLSVIHEVYGVHDIRVFLHFGHVSHVIQPLVAADKVRDTRAESWIGV